MKIRKLFNKYMTLFGILAPAPIISLFSKTAYVYFLIITVFIILIYSMNSKFICRKNFDKYYIIYTICVLLSSFICLVRMPSEWTSDVVGLIIQFICVFIIYLWFDKTENFDLSYSFVKGVYISAIVQMIWGYLQLFFNRYGIDLNLLVFDKILHMFEGEATNHTIDGGIKISGFCWNSGNFAPLMLIGYLLSNKPIVRIAFVLVSLLSGSRTLIVGIFVCVILKNFYLLKGKLKITKKKIIFWNIIFFLLMIVIINYFSQIQLMISNLIASLNVISNYKSEGSTNTHIMYIIRTLDIIRNNSFLTNMFGYGPRCSGYAFVSHYNFYSGIGKWCVECDYVNVLWNYGILGFVFYYSWFISNIVKYKGNYLRTIFFITISVMGIMYNVTFSWVQLFLIFIFCLNKNNIDIFE